MHVRGSVAVLAAAVLSATPVPPRTLAPSAWGGDHAAVTATASEVRLDFDCAHGSIAGAIALDADGRFDVRGVYTRESPGPVRSGASKGESARYAGRIDGGTMAFSIVLLGSGETVGRYTLTQDHPPRVHKCL